MELVAEEKLIVDFEDFPTLPAVALKLLKEAMRNDDDLETITQIIRNDPAITAKVLQVANSPVYGFKQKIDTLERAVNLLGATVVRSIALGLSFFEIFQVDDQPAPDFDLRDFWKHSLGCAILAEAIGKKLGYEDAGSVFVCGLLHDIGRLALFLKDPEGYSRVVRESSRSSESLMKKEVAAFGADHTVYGQRLASIWNFPRPLIDSIRHHHGPLPAGERQEAGRPAIHQIVCFADALVRNQWIGIQGYNIPTEISGEVWRYFSLRLKDEEALTRTLFEGIRQVSPIFDASMDIESIHLESLYKANQTLSKMSIELEQKSRKLRQELSKSRFSASLYENFRPGLDVTETLESAARVICQVVHGARTLGMIWIPGALEARVAVCEHPDAVVYLQRSVTEQGPMTGEAVLARAKVFICEHEDGMDPEALGRLLAEGKMLILPFDWLQVLEGCLVVDMRRTSKTLEKWVAGPIKEFTEYAGASLERAWLYDDLQRRMNELDKAHQQAESFQNQMSNAEQLAAVGSMAAGVAHEINNPLAIIRGQAQLLMMREVDGDRKNRLRIIDEQSNRISKVLTELMGIARPHRPRMGKVNVRDLIERLAAMFHHRFMSRRIEIEQEFSAQLPNIEADPDSLQQVLLNLIINADHAMEKDGRLALRAREAYGGKAVVIEIEDSGHGIARENLTRIFDPFFTTKERGKGTGLGLFTTMTIIRNMSGEIQVRSELQHGTCFTIILPCEQKHSSPVQRSLEDKRAQQDRPSRILVVDDETMVREILKEALSEGGYRVDTASDGQEGQEKIATGQYDCVIMDINMPRRSGLDVLKWLQSDECPIKSRPPVISITGVTDVNQTEQALCLGALACVKKPFSIDAIIDEVESALARHFIDSQH